MTAKRLMIGSAALAIAGLVTGSLDGGPPHLFCSATQHAPPLNEMAVMYLLMSVFHSSPWLKLIYGR